MLLRHQNYSFKRYAVRCWSSSLSSASSLSSSPSEMFTAEQRRQKQLIPRLEKIRVTVQHVKNRVGEKEEVETTQLLMNKHMSTPYNVAQHLSEVDLDRSALALVNGQVWDMHRVLDEDCEIVLQHFHQRDPFHVNRAFFRSCSIMLGAVIKEAIDPHNVEVVLHSFPPPNVLSGSFVYDVHLSLPSWSPSKAELQVFSAAMHRLAERRLPFERLVVTKDVALEMFENNHFKCQQIPHIAAASQCGDSVTVYRIGDHLDISKGPMVGDTSFLGRRCSITAAHQVVLNDRPLYRFQGVALPKNMFLNHFAFSILERRSAKLNTASLEGTGTTDRLESSTSASS